ncbi:Flagellar protein FlgJ [peptidoglycan hydrolase] [Sphingobium indicum BiD32]|uniref:Flagellar protein FlgJ [peptidoglycan hydrolase] n=1 Tax=Sphingobium indicum BiD32 TaxID=1301087 RepID=N1MP11_9SPHN|nr:rod-binding protein [Sphingobium indicum]CCW18970.1 Flagellar protein FlgJ [peptidoglycan hydrolase] [Sphingobium indicum BiD32]
MQLSSTPSATAASGAAPANKASLEKTAQQFEAIFLRQMIGAMRSASLAEGISDSSATEQFRDMADARTADAMAGTGSLGIATLLLRQFGGTVAAPAASSTEGP